MNLLLSIKIADVFIVMAKGNLFDLSFGVLITYYNGLNLEYIKTFTINAYNCLLRF